MMGQETVVDFLMAVVCCSNGENIVINKYFLVMLNKFWQYQTALF